MRAMTTVAIAAFAPGLSEGEGVAVFGSGADDKDGGTGNNDDEDMEMDGSHVTESDCVEPGAEMGDDGGCGRPVVIVEEA